jgi:hypothetical protein
MRLILENEDSTMEKTVYILGAGFSMPAGAPSQAALMRIVFAMKLEKDLSARRRNILKFLKDALNVDEKRVTLEDVYTPIDRCISDGIGLKSYSLADLHKVREDLSSLVGYAIKHELGNVSEQKANYVRKFARHLVEKASVRAQLAAGAAESRAAKAYDPLAVISLNWDILLDNALNNALRARDNGMRGDYDPFGVVDYCCYISSVDSEESRIRTGLWSLGCRGYNVKFLKIHGSMNWLQCSNCQQMFVGFDEKLILRIISESLYCRHCKKQGNHSLLRSSLVMPTFLKDLRNFQIKLVWQNAAIELMEARRLVFIGYSLPHADFEFRQLLSRMVHKHAKIDVVLWGKSENYKAECERYESFFSKHSLEFFPEGAEEYMRRFEHEEILVPTAKTT